RNIKIYGNGGRMLPLLNATPYPADLEENAVRFVGEEDGDFDSGDYILLYAEGVDNWNEESGTHNNLYASRSYYYVTSGSGPGKRIQQQLQPASAPTLNVSTFDEYQYHEQDLVNIARVGRKWLGEQFNINNEQEFDFEVPDIDTSVPVKITVSAAANSLGNTSMAVTANAAAIG
ncbi:peptidase C25, partial [Flavobacterium sp. ST-75]